MTNQNHSSVNPFGSPQPAAIYRPKYRIRTDQPSYALEGVKTGTVDADISGLLDALQALEEWRKQEADRGRQSTPRWHPDKLKALLLYITPLNKPRWQGIILQAARDWEASCAGLIQFIPVVRPDEADISVKWSQATVSGRDYEVGHTDRTIRPPQWIVQARITLMVQPEIDKHLTLEQIEKRLYTTALHELGHALGLEHSQYEKDVMHHRGWQNPCLSANDIQRLNSLYRQPPSSMIWL